MLDMKTIYQEAYRTLSGYGTVNHGGRMQDFVANELKPESVLDVGCGDASFVNYLNAKRIFSIGVDIAQDGGDIRNISFTPDSFEWSTAFDVLEHIPEDELDSALSELKRVAQKGMILSICYRDSIYSIDGQSLHQTVKPHEWWREKLEQYGKVEDFDIQPTYGYYIVRFE